MPSDRRTFLRHAAALGLLGPVAAAWACGDPDGRFAGDGSAAAATGGAEGREDLAGVVPSATDREGGSEDVANVDTRVDPTLEPADAGTVRVLAPTAEPPVAYLSRADMRLYLDPAYRDWAENRLAAYVSVTTGLWRIPRPEDDPRVPITPGDELREFEVLDLGLWDTAMTPTEGDVRLRLGAPVAVRVALTCAPLPTGDAWISAAPLVVQRRDGPVGEGGREDFVGVGTGTRHGDPACASAGDVVRLLTWVCPTCDSEAGKRS